MDVGLRAALVGQVRISAAASQKVPSMRGMIFQIRATVVVDNDSVFDPCELRKAKNVPYASKTTILRARGTSGGTA